MENRQAKLKIAYRRDLKNVGRQPTVQENLHRLQQEMQEIIGKIEEEMAGSVSRTGNRSPVLCPMDDE